MVENLTRRDFENLPAGALRIEFQGEQLPLAILEFRDLPPVSPRSCPFAVILGGPPTPMVAQGIHTLLHPDHGPLSLFIVPIGRDADSVQYELIFN
jgi:hypothetical protein